MDFLIEALLGDLPPGLVALVILMYLGGAALSMRVMAVMKKVNKRVAPLVRRMEAESAQTRRAISPLVKCIEEDGAQTRRALRRMETLLRSELDELKERKR